MNTLQQYYIRTQLAKEECPDYILEMLKGEAHHNHEFYESETGTFRWKKDPLIDSLFEYDAIDLNNFWMGALSKDPKAKNDLAIRKFYRDMGYSVYGYWEVFYWDVNNEYIDEYMDSLSETITEYGVVLSLHSLISTKHDMDPNDNFWKGKDGEDIIPVENVQKMIDSLQKESIVNQCKPVPVYGGNRAGAEKILKMWRPDGFIVWGSKEFLCSNSFDLCPEDFDPNFNGVF